MENQGDRLKQLIKKIGLNNKEFAKRLNVSPNYISILITGKKKINNKFIYNITKVIPNLNPNWFLNGEGDIFLQNITLNESGEPYKIPSQPEIKAHQNTLLESVNIFIDKLESKKNKDLTDLQDLKEAIKLMADIQKELDLL